MIKSFRINAQTEDAFAVTEMVVKKTGLLREMKKDGTPEGITAMKSPASPSDSSIGDFFVLRTGKDRNLLRYSLFLRPRYRKKER